MKYLTVLLTAILMLSGTMTVAEESPIAEIYGEKVYVRDLPLPPKMVETSKSTMSAEEFAQWKQDALRQTLAFGVMEEARKRFLKEMGMAPTRQEIDGYIAFLQRAQQTDRKQRAEEREKLQQELQQPGLGDERRAAAKKKLSVLEEMDKDDAPPATAAARKEQQESEQTVAAMTVAGWKFNQALYRKYGGRVVLQQAGLEPIDAHKAFMQELETSGAYKILDPAYQDLFKETREYFDKKFQYADQAEIDKYFASPWWLHAAEIKSQHP